MLISLWENYTSNTTDRWTCILITYGHCITNATVTIHYTDGCLYATCTQLVTAKHSIQSYGWMQSTDSGSLNVSQNGDCSQNYNLEITQHKFHKTSIKSNHNKLGWCHTSFCIHNILAYFNRVIYCHRVKYTGAYNMCHNTWILIYKRCV